MDQLRDTVNGQIRNAYPGAQIIWKKAGGTETHPLYSIAVQVEGSEKVLLILYVREDDITSRRKFPDLDNASWLIRDGNEKDLLASHDAVLVSYGVAGDGGEIWESSSGNNRKGSYRRLQYTRKLYKALSGYLEIPYTFTEHNIRLMVEGKPLEDVCDHTNSRYQRKR